MDKIILSGAEMRTIMVALYKLDGDRDPIESDNAAELHDKLAGDFSRLEVGAAAILTVLP